MSSSNSNDSNSEDKENNNPFKKDKLLLNKTKPSNLKKSKNNNLSNISTYTSKKKKKTKNSKFDKLLYEVNVQRNLKLLKDNDYNVNNDQLDTKEKKDKLLIYFQGKKIYIEIFNGNENASEVFFELLLKYKIVQCKRLSKNIDYIIFKEGHLKTKRYAVMNNIKMVNPLWVDDKINRNIFKDDNEYLVKTNMGDILLQEKVGKEDKGKVFEHELEAEFDENYANMIDKEREKERELKELKEKEYHQIKREKRKSKNPRNKNQIKFFTEEEAMKKDTGQNNNKSKTVNLNNDINKEKNENIDKNFNIEHSPIPMDIDSNEEKKEEEKIDEQNNSEEKNLKGLKNDENKDNIENKNNPSDDEIIVVETEKKKIFEVITDNIHNEIDKDDQNHNMVDSKNKKGRKMRSKTPFKIGIKTKYKKKIDTKLKSKDYKHKATFKKIMVTKVEETPLHNPNNLSNLKELIKTDDDIIDKDLINNELTNLTDINVKESEIDKTPKNATVGQKINIITYKLEEKEIQCLRNMDKFEYKGDLTNPLLDYGILYCSASVIILDKEKSKYDWKMYDFFFDKKLLVDFASFLFEFMTENVDNESIDAKETLDKLNKISMNEETYFLNKKIRYQRRSLINSLNIVENICDVKKDEKEEEKKEGINFILNYNIVSGEKRIIQRILKFYLKANVIKINLKGLREIKDKRSKSVGPNMKFNFKIKKAQIEEKIQKVKNNKNHKFQSLIKTRNQVIKTDEKINKNKKGNENKNIENIEIIDEIQIKKEKKKDEQNEILKIEDKDLNKEEKIDFTKIKGDTYLLSKDKVSNTNILKAIPNFKGVINFKYSFDSFWAGKLLDLKDEFILKKYSFE